VTENEGRNQPGIGTFCLNLGKKKVQAQIMLDEGLIDKGRVGGESRRESQRDLWF